MFLDRHDLPGVSAEELAEAHRQDLAVQETHDVRFHTYWFDPESGSVFCLAEGPTKEAVDAVHRDAHGQLANIVLELDPNAPLNAFLGTMPQFPAGTAYTESAVRAIVFTDICGSVEMTQQLGDDGHMLVLRQHNHIVRRELASTGGREVKHTGDGIMAGSADIELRHDGDPQRCVDWWGDCLYRGIVRLSHGCGVPGSLRRVEVHLHLRRLAGIVELHSHHRMQYELRSRRRKRGSRSDEISRDGSPLNDFVRRPIRDDIHGPGPHPRVVIRNRSKDVLVTSANRGRADAVKRRTAPCTSG